MRKKFVHKCDLNIEYKSLTSKIRKEHCCKYIYRKLFLISVNANYRQNLQMSLYAAEKERQKQLKSYPYVIHPLSLFRFYWEVFMILVFLLQTAIITHLVFATLGLKSVYLGYLYVHGVINVIYLIDFFLNFITGKFDKNKHIIILKPKEYIKSYFFTFALPDFISSLPLEQIYYILYNDLSVEERTAITICKFFHVFRFINYLNTIREKREFALHKFRIFQTILLCFVGFEYLVSFVGLAKVKDQKMFFSELSYKFILFATCNMIFGMEHDTLILHTYELFVHLMGRIFGVIITIIFLAQVVTYAICNYKTKLNYTNNKSGLNKYMQINNFSPYLNDRITQYQKFIYDDHFFNEKEIWAYVSAELKSKALYNILQKQLQSDIFKSCPEEVILQLILFLRKRVLMANDELFRAKTLNRSFFFIHRGSVKILNEDNEEVAHVFSGKVFTDIAPLYSGEETFRKYTVVADEITVAYGLKFKDLFEVLVDYPDCQKEVNNALRNRNELILNSTNSLDLDKYFNIDD